MDQKTYEYMNERVLKFDRTKATIEKLEKLIGSNRIIISTGFLNYTLTDFETEIVREALEKIKTNYEKEMEEI